jgi:RNA polymerase-binding protein DksA
MLQWCPKRQTATVHPRRNTFVTALHYTSKPYCAIIQLLLIAMNTRRLKHFREMLLKELKRHAQLVSEDQAAAIDAAGDGAKESADLSLRDVIEEIALKLGDQESQMVADIDQALLRIREGSYGICARCGRPIDERRLEAMPTARYDAVCQTVIEEEKGKRAHPSL